MHNHDPLHDRTVASIRRLSRVMDSGSPLTRRPGMTAHERAHEPSGGQRRGRDQAFRRDARARRRRLRRAAGRNPRRWSARTAPANRRWSAFSAAFIGPTAADSRSTARRCRFGSPHDAIAAGIVTIPQELRLVPALSIAENIALGDPPVRRFGPLAAGRSRAHARRGAAPCSRSSTLRPTPTGRSRRSASPSASSSPSPRRCAGDAASSSSTSRRRRWKPARSSGCSRCSRA